MTRWLAVVLAMAALTGAVARADEPAAPQPDPTRRTILIFFDLVNTSEKVARDVTLSAVLPGTCGHQQVHQLLAHPAPRTNSTDRFGQQRTVWGLGDLAPGESASVQVLVQATVQPVAVDLKADPPPCLPPGERLDYLRDDPKWLQVEEVRKATADWVPTPSQDVSERAMQFFTAIQRKCVYVLDNKRDGPTDVIRAGRGSCTELAFVFIAMCRASGVPARMVSGWTNHGAGNGALDTVNHRWAEYWDDRYGWVPVDLARAITHAASNPWTYDPNLYFGRVAGQCLGVYDDGAKRGQVNNWAGYFVTVRKDGSIAVNRSSAWLATGDAEAERKLFLEASRQIGRGPNGATGEQLGEWAAGDAPLSRYLLLPLLGKQNAALRRMAAERLAGAADATLAGGLLVAARHAADGDRAFLIDQVARMLANPSPDFRISVLTEIGRSRVDQARALAVKAAGDDPNLWVRWAARKAIESLDKAAEGDEGDPVN